MQTLGVVAACFGVIAAVGKVFKTVNLGAGTMKFFKVISSIATQLKNSGTRALAGAMTLVGLGINLAMNVASFLIQWLVGGMRLGQRGVDAGRLRDRDADLLLPLHGPGRDRRLIQSLIGLVDILVGLICNAAGVTAEKNAMAEQVGVRRAHGALVNGIKALFYAGNVMVDMQDPDRLKTGNFQLLVDGPYGDDNLGGQHRLLLPWT